MPYVSPFSSGSAGNSTPPAGGSPASTGSSSGYISPFKGSMYTADYWNKTNAQNTQINQANDSINKLNDIGSGKSQLGQADQSNLINNSFKQGLIKKEDQIKLLNTMVDNNQAKQNQIQAQKDNTPFNFVKNLVLAPFESGIRVVQGAGSLLGTQIAQTQQTAALQGQAAFNKGIDAALAQGKISLDQANSAKATLQQKASQYSQVANGMLQESNKVDPTSLAADTAMTFLNLATLGGGKVLQAGAGTVKDLATQFLSGGVKQVAKTVGTNAIKGGVEGGLIGGGFGALGAAQQGGVNTNLNDVTQGTIQGAVPGALLGAGGSLIGGGIKAVMAKGANARLDAMAVKLGKNGTTESLGINPTDAQIRGMTPQKINVNGGDVAPTKIGVSTPLKVGVKDISQTDNVQVRTPNQMTDQQYTKQFNAISKSYDTAQKNLETMPPARQKIMSNAIDNQHQAKLDALDQAYHSPEVPAGTSKIQTVSKETTKAPANIGGEPSGFVNTDGKQLKVKTPTNDVPSSQRGSQTVTDTSTPVKSGQIKSQNDTAKATPAETTTPDTGIPGKKYTGASLKTEARAVAAGAAPTKDKAMYETVKHTATAEQAVKDVQSNYEAVKKDVFNKDSNMSPDKRAIYTEAVFREAQNREDYATMSKMGSSDNAANLQASQQAQGLGARGFASKPGSALSNIREVTKIKENAYKTKTGKTVAESVKAEDKVLSENIKAPSKNDWASFIDQLQC